MENCPCKSGHSYSECCQPYHQGKNPESAEKLMRSRFCAYAKNLPLYIIETTDPAGKAYNPHLTAWREQIETFCKNTEFLGLDILSSSENSVRFRAHLRQNGKDASFTELSHFTKKGERWFYSSGEVS